MVVGLGIDLIEVQRIRQVFARHGEKFIERIFSPGEAAYCAERGDPMQHFAARFAAKEATVKALGGWRGLRWRDIVCASGKGAAPQLIVAGPLGEAFAKLGVGRSMVSLTHTDQIAGAVVVLEAL